MKKAIFLFLTLWALAVAAQPKDVRAAFRLDFYMNEPQTEFHVALAVRPM